MRHCIQCKKEHEEIAFCLKCGKCLYRHGKQLPDKEYPFFQCECGQINFWD